MGFQSILGESGYPECKFQEPGYFVDLNLDQVFKAVAEKYKDFDLIPLFQTPLHRIEDIVYRQQVFTDLENDELLKGVRAFSDGMRNVIRSVNSLERLYEIQREGVFLASAETYCRSIIKFLSILRKGPVESLALQGLAEYLENYTSSESFRKLKQDAERVRTELRDIRYTLVMGPGRITVRKPGEIGDYTSEIRKIFSKFQDVSKGMQKFGPRDTYGVNHVEAGILLLIEKFYPNEFMDLRKFYSVHMGYPDKTIENVYREIQFYLSYLDYIDGLKKAGLKFCIPEISNGKNNIMADSCFDLALASSLSRENKKPVTNNFHLENGERIIVVTGPNNGGKTTFARSLGQIFHLTSVGLPVPGSRAVIELQDAMFTHFERAEEMENLRGKLEDDLIRIKNILDRSTERSVIIINEMLSSTTVKDATHIGERLIERIRARKSLCVFVTFLDEFTRYESTVSMVAQIDPDNPEIRTFKILREPPNGLAYAMALAKKYGVTYSDIMERIKSE